MPLFTSAKTPLFRLAASAASTAVTMVMVLAVSTSPANAQVAVRHSSHDGRVVDHRSTTVRTPNAVIRHSNTVVDRGRPGWWRGHSGFAGYAGPRRGHFFAPGHGYYPIPRGHSHTTWVVGRPYPSVMRRYVVIAPASYGLMPAPPGYGWYYGGANFVLVALSTGMIAQSVAGGW